MTALDRSEFNIEGRSLGHTTSWGPDTSFVYQTGSSSGTRASLQPLVSTGWLLRVWIDIRSQGWLSSFTEATYWRP